MMTTHSLTGKENLNKMGLKGFAFAHSIPVSTKIKQIKSRIVEDYLVPLFTNQWTTLNENSFFIENMQKKINFYYQQHKSEELLAYCELLRVIKKLIENYQTLETYEKQSYSVRLHANEVTSMIFKTTKVRLLPEYEIYDSILGKPKKELEERYDENIIATIKCLLEKEDCTYHKIQSIIMNLIHL
jgi:hypothetical protein